jgi:AcrR family transcriptional regulator
MYHYFSSKRGLFSALLDWVLEPFLQDVENIGRQEGTSRELLNELAWRFDVLFERSRDTYALLFYLYTCPHQPEIQDLVDAWTLRLSESVDRMITSSANRRSCPSSLVLSLFGSRVHRYSREQSECTTLLHELTQISLSF